MVGRNRNAFCVVRPPGHHAGVNGLLAGGESCGFCIFNSVAAGAMHALSKAKESHSPGCERVAIVDIDAHHGNGTEEIVQKCHDPSRLFFFSVHIFDHDKKKGIKPDYSFYPGTGACGCSTARGCTAGRRCRSGRGPFAAPGAIGRSRS